MEQREKKVRKNTIITYNNRNRRNKGKYREGGLKNG
jgi:hypothetical protein